MLKDVFPIVSSPKPESVFRVACFGDVVARGAVAALRRKCSLFRSDFSVDFIVANGENATGGVGLDLTTFKDLKNSGVDVVTMGDHVWSKRDLISLFENETGPARSCIRPANYPDSNPGQGISIVEINGHKVAVINLIGRVFSNYSLDCPFMRTKQLLSQIDAGCRIIIIDFHSEATSEKIALGKMFDGKVSLVFGTHTHVQTSDAQIFPQGTGFITDLGMCGTNDGVIGLDAEIAIRRFLTGAPHSYKPAAGLPRLSGVIADIDFNSGNTVDMAPFNFEVRV